MDFIINYWIEVTFSTIIFLIGYLYKKIIEYKKLMNATKNGVQALLKAKIIEKYNDYNIIGKMTIYDKETVNLLYNEYKNLNGNGVIDKLFDELQKIPLKKSTKGGVDGG